MTSQSTTSLRSTIILSLYTGLHHTIMRLRHTTVLQRSMSIRMTMASIIIHKPTNRFLITMAIMAIHMTAYPGNRRKLPDLFEVVSCRRIENLRMPTNMSATCRITLVVRVQREK